MRKIIILLVFSIFLSTVGFSPYIEPNPKEIIVDERIRPYWEDFITLVAENDLNVDWSKINSVGVVPLDYNIQGYWAKSIKSVMVAYYFKFPPVEGLTLKEKDDLILLTLAHEVGHSQGLLHIEKDKVGLMNPHSKYDLLLVRSKNGVRQYIIDAYKAGLKEKTPN